MKCSDYSGVGGGRGYVETLVMAWWKCAGRNIKAQPPWEKPSLTSFSRVGQLGSMKSGNYNGFGKRSWRGKTLATGLWRVGKLTLVRVLSLTSFSANHAYPGDSSDLPKLNLGRHRLVTAFRIIIRHGLLLAEDHFNKTKAQHLSEPGLQFIFAMGLDIADMKSCEYIGFVQSGD
jgi:hypothetical protein